MRQLNLALLAIPWGVVGGLAALLVSSSLNGADAATTKSALAEATGFIGFIGLRRTGTSASSPIHERFTRYPNPRSDCFGMERRKIIVNVLLAFGVALGSIGLVSRHLGAASPFVAFAAVGCAVVVTLLTCALDALSRSPYYDYRADPLWQRRVAESASIATPTTLESVWLYPSPNATPSLEFLVRRTLTLSPGDAARFIELAPCLLRSHLEPREAERLAGTFREQGAEIAIRPDGADPITQAPPICYVYQP